MKLDIGIWIGKVCCTACGRPTPAVFFFFFFFAFGLQTMVVVTNLPIEDMFLCSPHSMQNGKH